MLSCLEFTYNFLFRGYISVHLITEGSVSVKLRHISLIKFLCIILGDCTAAAPPMLPSSHDDLASQHYQAQQQYPGYNCAQPDFSNYGPMYSNYMKCRTNPYQRPQPPVSTTSPNVSSLASSAAMYYPGFSNAAAAAAAAGLYTRPHNMYDYSGMPHHTEIPR